MWLLPSRGRPHLAERLFREGKFSTPGLLIIDDDEHQKYDSVRLPSGWETIVRPRMYLSGKINAGFSHKPEEPWYGVLNDDHVPITKDWDRKLVAALKGPLVWPQDNYGDRISTPVMDGEFARKLGWVACPDLNHFYLDDVNELIADCFGCTRLEDVMVSHEHVNAGRMAPDLTWKERPNNATDQKAFIIWCRDKWPEIRKRLEC
jgi:hypothetical protein